MREIKFRAKTNEKSANPGTIIYIELFSFKSWDLIDPESLQQYTGLKDKNGKEIWEGDILRTKLNPDQTQNGQVEFDEGNYKLNGYDLRWVASESSVIGNIYENPELLK